MNPIVLIPARLASTRLPNKALADIHGAPMIVHVWRRAVETDAGRVVVAAGDAAIAEAVRAAGGEAVLTDPGLPSGTDRIHQALDRLDPDGTHDVVVNIQGDLPVLEAKTVRAAIDALIRTPSADWGTVACPIANPADLTETSVNKVVAAWEADGAFGRALYFSKLPVPWGEGEVFHHIGLYTYRRAALDRFVALPPSPLEVREKLEQLRALENGMRIEVGRVETIPLGVDTEPQLIEARRLLAP
ncbi:MAG: 3-deoxy-manno-octulosonate cytidylyltransferase [Alphaproteobacteria bacterium]|nr:3-deoxy-manno-octulosonate cytidylyltransferase [Alphaproteobacteria bacterium]